MSFSLLEIKEAEIDHRTVYLTQQFNYQKISKLTDLDYNPVTPNPLHVWTNGVSLLAGMSVFIYCY